VGDQVLELILEPSTDRYDPLDDRWLDQVMELRASLRDEGVQVYRRDEPTAGQKGGIETLIMALGSAGVFSVALECLKAWLGRDRTRRVHVVSTAGGEERTFTLTADANEETFRELTALAMGQLQGP
jgi:hypothetical protein